MEHSALRILFYDQFAVDDEDAPGILRDALACKVVVDVVAPRGARFGSDDGRRVLGLQIEGGAGVGRNLCWHDACVSDFIGVGHGDGAA